MKKIIRLSESDLRNMVDRSAKRIIEEHINYDKEMQLAYKEVQQMGKHLSSVGLRLNGTEFEPLYQKMRDGLMALNNALIKKLRGN